MNKNVYLCVIILFLFLPIKTTEGSWTYRPFSAVLRKADIILTAQVIRINQDDTKKYAIVKPLEIIKGEWRRDSVLILPVHELPKTGMISSTDYEVLYDSGASYLLLLASKNGHIVIANFPWISQIKIEKDDKFFVSDVEEMLRIDTISVPSKKAMQYTSLLKSPNNIIRESVAWELGQMECPEALTGLRVALKDTVYMVIVNALTGFDQLGRKGIISSEAAASIESVLIYSFHLNQLLRALAAQKGHAAIPFIREFSRIEDPKIATMQALAYLKDSTALPLFREAILFDRSWFLKVTALIYISFVPEMFPDSFAIPLAMRALDYQDEMNEGVQVRAIRILEERTGKSFGDVQSIGGNDFQREKIRNKIIKKWKKWYTNLQKK